MPDTGWKLAGAAAQGTVNSWSGVHQDYAWSSPSNITNTGNSSSLAVTDGNYALGRTRAIIGYGFGFNIPEEMEIIGIEARIYVVNHSVVAHALPAMAVPSGASVIVSPVSGGDRKQFSIPSSPTTPPKLRSVGGAADRWGLPTASLDVINDPRFGIAFCFGSNRDDQSAVALYYMEARVHYRNATDQPDTDDPGLYMRNPARTKWQLTRPWFKDPDTGTWRRVRFWKKSEGIWRRT